MNRPILPYQSIALDHLNKVCDFTGKKILEIGGSPPFNVAHELLNRGAKKVVSIDHRPDLKDQKFSENFEFCNMDARRMRFDRNEFDVIIGIAVLEHLHDLRAVLDEAHRVTATRGYVYLHGGPLWSCNLGHHVWVYVDGIAYEFTGNNPIPHWYHLIYQKKEMQEYLETQGIIPEHSKRIVEMIYEDPILNRYPYEQIMTTLRQSKLSIESLNETNWGVPDKETMKKLQSAEPQDRPRLFRIFDRTNRPRAKNHSTGEIEAIMRK